MGSFRERIEAKSAARDEAREVWALAIVSVEGIDAKCAGAGEAFWDEFRKLFRGNFPEPNDRVELPASAMDEREAQEFESTIWRGGIHGGKRVVEIPPSYFLAITESRQARELRRYMASRRFMDKQAEPDGDEV